MVLLRRYRLSKRGDRGYCVSIPNVFVEGAGLRLGQSLAMYRDGDRLILVPEKKEARS